MGRVTERGESPGRRNASQESVGRALSRRFRRRALEQRADLSRSRRGRAGARNASLEGAAAQLAHMLEQRCLRSGSGARARPRTALQPWGGAHHPDRRARARTGGSPRMQGSRAFRCGITGATSTPPARRRGQRAHGLEPPCGAAARGSSLRAGRRPGRHGHVYRCAAGARELVQQIRVARHQRALVMIETGLRNSANTTEAAARELEALLDGLVGVGDAGERPTCGCQRATTAPCAAARGPPHYDAVSKSSPAEKPRYSWGGAPSRRSSRGSSRGTDQARVEPTSGLSLCASSVRVGRAGRRWGGRGLAVVVLGRRPTRRPPRCGRARSGSPDSPRRRAQRGVVGRGARRKGLARGRI